MRNQFDKFSTEETDQLITEILNRIPALIDVLPDKKILEDYYGTIRWYEKEQDYKWHRFKQQLFRGSEPTVQFPPYRGIQFTADKQYHAALMGMICVMAKIFSSVCTVYHPDSKKYHEFGAPNEVQNRVESVARKSVSSIESNWDNTVASDEISAFYEHETNQFVFLVYVFRFLRRRGYNWQYRSDYLDFSKRVEDGRIGPSSDHDGNENEEDMAFSDHIDLEDLVPAHEYYNRRDWRDLIFESEYFKFVAEEPEDVIQAYTYVYGVEPEGYPPRMDDY